MTHVWQATAPRFDSRTESAAYSTAVLATDAAIINELASLSDADDDFWTFRRGAARRQAHGLSQYPAMMVPSMQAVLMGVVAKAVGDIRSVVDPFVGSGTTLTEAMRLGLDFSGQDINPLAVLISRVKAGPFHVRRLRRSADRVVAQAREDRSAALNANFSGLNKWFQPAVAVELSRIRRAIRTETNVWCRRVLWTALAETVRLSSNSRTSTFKLHIRSADDLKTRSVQAVETFADITDSIVTRLTNEAATLRDAGHLSPSGSYRRRIVVELGDSSSAFPSCPSRQSGHGLLITSPPYGDNTSTVPYGQYSYLPLQWIDLHDIHKRADPSYLASTYEIDSRSLGGGRKTAMDDVKQLRKSCPSLDATLKRLARLPADRSSRVAAFCRDLDSSLDASLAALRPNGYMIWTVGNRRVGGDEVPTDEILTELMGIRGAVLVTSIQRQIPSKRMATRNNVATTMRGETILLFRKEA